MKIITITIKDHRFLGMSVEDTDLIVRHMIAGDVFLDPSMLDNMAIDIEDVAVAA